MFDHDCPDEYRDLISTYVARAGKEQFIADQLTEEARRRLGAKTGVPTETE